MKIHIYRQSFNYLVKVSSILFITSEDFEQCIEVGSLGPGSVVGGEGKKEKGEIGKIAASNRSKLSGGKDYRLACFARPMVFLFIYLFLSSTSFFSS